MTAATHRDRADEDEQAPSAWYRATVEREFRVGDRVRFVVRGECESHMERDPADALALADGMTGIVDRVGPSPWPGHTVHIVFDWKFETSAGLMTGTWAMPIELESLQRAHGRGGTGEDGPCSET